MLDLLIVFAVFLGVLAVGLSVPFAIALPGLVYLLLHGGLPALKGLGLVSWGSMNSFTLTAIPLFVLMAELIQRSGLSHRTYVGLAKLVAPIPGGLLQTNIASCAMFAAINGSSVATAAPQHSRRHLARPSGSAKASCIAVNTQPTGFGNLIRSAGQ